MDKYVLSFFKFVFDNNWFNELWIQSVINNFGSALFKPGFSSLLEFI